MHPSPRTPVGMLALGALLAGCEQPVRPSNPAPLQAAADHLGVPVGWLADLQAMAARIQPPAPSGGAGPSLAGPRVEELRRTLDRLEQQVTAPPRP